MKKIFFALSALLILVLMISSCEEEKPCMHDDINNITVYEAKAATCSENGLTEGKKCNLCGVTIVSQTTIPATGCIELETLPQKEPTCQNVGLTEGIQCKKCYNVVIPQIVMPIIDCVEGDWIIDVEPTTTSDGVKHTECTVCHKKIKEESIPAIESEDLENIN